MGRVNVAGNKLISLIEDGVKEKGFIVPCRARHANPFSRRMMQRQVAAGRRDSFVLASACRGLTRARDIRERFSGLARKKGREDNVATRSRAKRDISGMPTHVVDVAARRSN